MPTPQHSSRSIRLNVTHSIFLADFATEDTEENQWIPAVVYVSRTWGGPARLHMSAIIVCAASSGQVLFSRVIDQSWNFWEIPCANHHSCQWAVYNQSGYEELFWLLFDTPEGLSEFVAMYRGHEGLVAHSNHALDRLLGIIVQDLPPAIRNGHTSLEVTGTAVASDGATSNYSCALFTVGLVLLLSSTPLDESLVSLVLRKLAALNRMLQTKFARLLSWVEGVALATQFSRVVESLGRRTIHDLPDELLLDVFKWTLIIDEFQLEYLGGPKVVIPRIVALSHVCRLWRNIALGYPHFWTHVDDRYRQRLDAFVERSGTQPLWLSLNSDTEGLENILSAHATRLQRVDLTVKFGYEGIPPILHHPHLPSLRCFTISYEDVAPQEDAIASPIILFGQESSRLTALAVVFAANWWAANRFPNLTHLHMVLQHLDGTPPSESLIKLLSNAPVLQHLHIYGLAAVADSEPPAPPPPPALLPHMQSITFIQSDLLEVLDVLTSLVIPSTVFVRLSHMYTSDLLPELPYLAVFDSVTRMEMATSQEFMHFVVEGPNSGLWLDCELTGEALEQDDWTEWVGELHTTVPLPRIDTLQIYLDTHVEIFEPLLRHMVALSSLSIRFENELEIEANTTDDIPPAKVVYNLLAQSDCVLCPNIRTLVIDIPAQYYPVLSPLPIPMIHATSLVYMISERKLMGHPLGQVVLQPFADVADADENSFAHIVAQFLETEQPKELSILKPGPSISPFKERALWDVDGKEQFWIMADIDRPMYALPWDR
ncbi:hypothetical protein C8Q76DRAFT_695120 [Earliella scabrosa]|nr:hypothetical protein C8Q76DRAFT_695120 [Earliella scabrosa]